jgi:hypothetical protein
MTKPMNGNTASRGIVRWIVMLIIVLAIVAAVFTYNLDKLAKYEFAKLTYRVTNDKTAYDFSRFYARTSGKISVAMDIRAFTYYAFITGVMEYDEELGSSMTVERLQLRKDMAGRMATVPFSRVNRWRKYYESHPYGEFSYLSYVLGIGAPPDFLNITPRTDISSTSFYSLAGFREILTEFYETCRIEELYNWHRSAGLFGVVEHYDLKIIEERQKFANNFLKGDGGILRDMTLTIIPMPYESHYKAYSISYGDLSYIIDGPDSSDGFLNWHEYAHFFVTPIVRNTVWAYSAKFRKVLADNISKSYVSGSYERLDTFVAECFVRALDHRLQVMFAPEWARSSLKKKLSSVEKDEVLNGLALIPYFVAKLDDYEKDSSFEFSYFVKKALSSY